MVKFDSARFMRLTAMIHSMTEQFTAFPGGIPGAIQSSLSKFSVEAQSLCTELGMLVSAEAARYCAFSRLACVGTSACVLASFEPEWKKANTKRPVMSIAKAPIIC